jgi:hypothetical protein
LPRAETSLGVVADLWRYPVKSFGGERLRRAFVGPFGLLGDRRFAVTAGAEPATARRTPGLLAFRASYRDREAAEGPRIWAPDGTEFAPLDGALARTVGGVIGQDVAVAESPLGFFDAAPLHILGEPSIRALSASAGTELDRRRFRANILVDPAAGAPFEEDGWVGRRLSIGDVLVEVVVNTERCAVTTFDPDTLEREPKILRTLADTRDNLFGVYARVLRAGWMATGDPIRPAPAG